MSKDNINFQNLFYFLSRIFDDNSCETCPFQNDVECMGKECIKLYIKTMVRE